MSRDEWLWWGAGVAALVIAVLLVVVYVAGRRRARDLEAQVNLLRERLAGLERDAAPPASPATEAAPRASEYLITGLGTPEPEPGPGPAAPTVDSRLFADLVLRETVVRAASLAHGVRRGLAPEARNRIRFEMRREARRSRKQRRSDLREAQQFLRDRARARRDGVQDAG